MCKEKNVGKVIAYMQNYIESVGHSKEHVHFNLEPLGKQFSENTASALEYTGCTEDKFFEALNVCIGRGYVTGPSYLGTNYGGLKLKIIPGGEGVYASTINVYGDFNQIGDGNTQNNR